MKGSSVTADEVCCAGGRGYASRAYAESLREFGKPRELARSGGWLLERPAPDGEGIDATGCYPLFCCRDWRGLADDLNLLRESVICVSLVSDSFADVSAAELQAAFPDVCYLYKQHFVTDLSVPLEKIVHSHHRRNARKALDAIEVRIVGPGEEILSMWQPLYDNLVRRHDIRGIAGFSPQSFATQISVPGLTAFAAFDGDDVCGMTLWYLTGDVAYYHLAAYSERGYERGASFALFWTALAHFAELGARWAALGASAGTNPAESGLSRFKQGWATGTRPVYFCGRIMQPDKYRQLIKDCSGPNDYFPAYRRP